MSRKRLLIFRPVAWVIVLTLILVGAGWPLEAAQNKKKRNKKNNSKQTSTSVTQVVNKVDRQVLAYSPQKAREILQPVADDNDPELEAARGRVLILEKDYDQAAQKLQAAANRSDDPFVLIDLGDAYNYARNQSKAQSSYREAAQKAEGALADKPGDAHARLTLGVAQQRQKQYNEAIANLEQAQTADPSNERIAFELGLTQMLRGDNQAGFDQLTRAIDLNSGYAYAYYYRGLAADRINRKDVMVNDLDRFLFLAPSAPEAEKARRMLESARG